MLKIKVDLSGFKKKTQSFVTKLRRLAQWLSTQLHRTQIELQAIAPVRTGKLRASISGKLFSQAGSDIRGLMIADVPYASFQKDRMKWDKKRLQLSAKIHKKLTSLKG